MGIYDQQILGAEQQQETARKLREGITTPQGQMVSGWYVPPSITQYMAEALKSYYAGKEGASAKDKYDTLTKQKADETAKYLGELQPKANTTLTDAGMQQFTQPQDFSTQGAIDKGLNPQPQPMATQTTYTQPDEQTRMAALSRLLAVNPEVGTGQAGMEQWQIGREDKKAAAAQAIQDKLELQHQAALDRAAMIQGGNQKPYFQFLPTAEGYAIGNARTGQINKPGTGGTVAVRATDNPTLQGQITQAKETGKGLGEAQTSLSAAESSLPQLEKTVSQLKDLADKATYTLAGQGRDIVARQAGVATEGAIAREKYIQTVRDVLFPQLRATFGAQFTVREGEALVATMGDPNKTPQERVAALESFIDQKKQHIESLRRQTGKDQNNSTATNLSSEDRQAISWAKANQNDPRSSQILKLHGM
jgi:hypothetical protein